MNSEKKCEVLCSQSNKPVTLTVEQSRLVAERITEDYYVHLIADNLPVATRLELYSNRDSDDKKKEKDVQFEHGYRLGFTDVNKIYLHNHLSFILYYHREDMEEDQACIRVARDWASGCRAVTTAKGSLTHGGEGQRIFRGQDIWGIWDVTLY